MERTRAQRRRAWPLFVFVLAALFAPGAAQAAGAHLDAGFGSGGVRFLPRQFLEDTGAGLLGDGRVAVADGTEILALLPSGRIDPSFGNAGYASYAIPSASAGVDAYAFGLDDRGRPVVAGEAALPESNFTVPAGEAFVERFTGAGDPDPSFGGGAGYVVGGITLPPPEDGEPSDSYYNGLGFDGAGRIVLSGGRKTGRTFTKNGPVPVYAPFLARLQGSGSVDGSFAGGGTYLAPPGAWTTSLGKQVVLAAANPGGVDSLLRLDEGGRPDPTFGTAGYAPYPPGFANVPPRVDPRGRTILRRFLPGVRHKLANGVQIARLLPDGSVDRSFGKQGIDRLRIPGLVQSEIAFDEQGRILLEVRLDKRRKDGSTSEELALMRLLANGRVDKTFGRGGMLRLPSPGAADVYPEGAGSLVVKGDRALIRAVYDPPRGPRRPIVALVDLGR